MSVLGIDTAGPVVGAALWSSSGVRLWSQRIVRKADSVLLPAIAELLAGEEELELIAVSVGPGAFTGLRVGVSVALGLAVARDLPVVAISSLAARASMARTPRTLALLDARKGKVYAGLFDTSGEQPVPLSAEVDATPDDAFPAAPFMAVGEGAVVYAEAILAAGGQVSPDASRCPADEVARLGALGRDTAMDAGSVALRYLRPPDARPPKSVGQRIGRRSD
ncbi:MAG: tRNA threonylcarbamoyladenosine biosynthesis protein TsaB [Myxococcota bacterium]|jgi:tRNA threonylcarbamoyladenosine biosynthesis protein TsaB